MAGSACTSHLARGFGLRLPLRLFDGFSKQPGSMLLLHLWRFHLRSRHPRRRSGLPERVPLLFTYAALGG